MAETEINSLTINKGSLYPFLYVKRGDLSRLDGENGLENAILAIRVNNAQRGYYYRIRFFKYVPENPTTNDDNGWVICKIKIDDYLNNVDIRDIDITSARTAQPYIDPNGGIQRFTIETNDGDTTLDIVIDPSELQERVQYVGNFKNQYRFQYIIDPLFYHYESTAYDALTINAGRLYPFIYKKRGDTFVYSGRVNDIEKAILAIKVINAEPGYYYQLRFFGHAPGDYESAPTNNGWSFVKTPIEDYEAGGTSFESITLASSPLSKREIDNDGGIQRFRLDDYQGGATSFEIVIDGGLLPRTTTYFNYTASSSVGYQYIIDPIFYEYRQGVDKDEVSSIVSSTYNNMRKKELNFEYKGVSSGYYGVLPIDPFGQPRFDSILKYATINTATYPASITKIMTALVALESGLELTSKITIKKVDIAPGSGQNVQENDVLTFENALHNMLLVSSSTTANAIARTVGEKNKGTYATFMNMVNQKAEQIGMSNTKFTNASGLHDPEHVTTVKALMLLGWHASLNSIISSIWSKTEFTIDIEGPNARTEYLKSTYAELAENPWFIGGKTGSLNEVGYNILSHVQLDNGYTGIAVCLGSRSESRRKEDLEEIVNHIRNNYAYPAPDRIIAK